MQPVLTDLKALQTKWNSSSVFHIQSRQDIEQNVRWSQRAAYLRVLHIAIMVFAAFTVSTTVCFALSGIITTIGGQGGLTPLIKLIAAALFGILSYDLVRLRSITDRCRILFREVLYHINNKTLSDEHKVQWDREIREVNEQYKDLVVIDTAIDTLYPILVNH